MFHHGFTDETPIEEQIRSYLGLDIKEKSLKKVLSMIAEKYDERYSNIQSTYGQFSAHSLNVKFGYLVTRVINLYGINEEEEENVRQYYRELTSALKTVRKAKDPWPDFDLPGKKTMKTSFTPLVKTGSKVEKETDAVHQVTLYKYDNGNLSLDSYASFENTDLLVDFGKLAGDYEDEYFIRVKEADLSGLYGRLNIKMDDRSTLLMKIAELFSGQDGFERFRTYLEENEIHFQYNVRHD